MSRRPRTLVAAVLLAAALPLVLAPSAAALDGGTTQSIKGPGRCC